MSDDPITAGPAETAPLRTRTRPRVKHAGGGESRTKQSDRQGTDLRSMVERYHRTGALPPGRGNPVYGDFSAGLDYHAALMRVQAAEDDFARLPARVRSAVDNDPGKFLDLVFDPKRVEELKSLGLTEEQLPLLPEPTAPKPPFAPG